MRCFSRIQRTELSEISGSTTKEKKQIYKAQMVTKTILLHTRITIKRKRERRQKGLKNEDK